MCSDSFCVQNTSRSLRRVEFFFFLAVQDQERQRTMVQHQNAILETVVLVSMGTHTLKQSIRRIPTLIVVQIASAR